MVAEPEKALLDGLYLNIFSENDLKELSQKIDLQKLKGLVKRFNGHGKKKLGRMIGNA